MPKEALIPSALAALGFGAAAWLSWRLRGRLKSLADAAAAAAAGDLTVQVPAGFRGGLGRLAAALNHLIHRLKYYSLLDVEKVIIRNREADAIVSSLDEGVVVLDSEGRLVSANPAARRLLAMPPAGAALCLPETLAGMLGDRASLHDFLWRPDASRPGVWLSYIRSDIVDPEGRGLGRVFTLRDVTAGHELEKVKDDYYSLLAHDLRSPLASVRMTMDTLKESVPGMPADAAPYIEVMDRSIDDMLRLISQVLDIGRIESGKLALKPRTLHVRELFQRARDSLAAQAGGKGVSFVIDVARPEPHVAADRDHAFRAVLNLAANALRSTPNGGTVTLAAGAPEGGFVSCSVRDEGKGLSAEELARVFDKFAQLRKVQDAGTRLGLSVAKAVVEAHGGDIWAESAPGAGSTFRFTLPAAPDDGCGSDAQPGP